MKYHTVKKTEDEHVLKEVENTFVQDEFLFVDYSLDVSINANKLNKSIKTKSKKQGSFIICVIA